MGSRRRRHRHLPEGIIEDIVVKLPVKSIIRFQSVSKSWFHLIKSSRFISKHQIETDESIVTMFSTLRRSEPWDTQFLATGSRNRDILRCDSKTVAVYTLSGFNFEWLPSYSFVRYLEEGDLTYVEGDCNGILCLTNYKNIMLVNPSRKEVKSLPNPILPKNGCPLGHWDCKLVGFGFDNMTMDFTVVRVLSFNYREMTFNNRWEVSIYDWGDLERRVEVYNLRSNAWRVFNVSSFPELVDHSFKGSTFFDGVIHWCGKTRVSGCGILTFNMADNLFSQLELPQGWYENREDLPFFRLFVLSQESLAFLSYTQSSFVNVWIMNKHGIEAAWTRLYSTGPLTQFELPLSLWNKHKLIYKTTDGKIILYDLLNHDSSVVCDDVSQFRLPDPIYEFCRQFRICRPSLVSINN